MSQSVFRATPEIPDWIRGFRAQPLYTSIFEIYPNERRLYGTEDWHGDWNARVLFLAKDAGSSRIFRPISSGGRGWAWITNPARPTNRNLAPLLNSLPNGKLYASFLGPLLRNDDQESGNLPMTSSVARFATDLFLWTASEMTNMDTVAVLGREAWLVVTRAVGHAETFADWKRRHSSGEPLQVSIAGKTRSLVSLYHPARISSERLLVQPGWSWIMNQHERISAVSPKAADQQARSVLSMSSEIAQESDQPAKGTWRNLSPAKTKQQKPVGIRAEMLRILRNADSMGVPSRAFQYLEWQTDGFREDKLRKAMQILSGEAACEIQVSNDAPPTRWRLKPS